MERYAIFVDQLFDFGFKAVTDVAFVVKVLWTEEGCFEGSLEVVVYAFFVGVSSELSTVAVVNKQLKNLALTGLQIAIVPLYDG